MKIPDSVSLVFSGDYIIPSPCRLRLRDKDWKDMPAVWALALTDDDIETISVKVSLFLAWIKYNSPNLRETKREFILFFTIYKNVCEFWSQLLYSSIRTRINHLSILLFPERRNRSAIPSIYFSNFSSIFETFESPLSFPPKDNV